MLIRGARAYVDGKFQETDILVEGEKIAGVGNRLGTAGQEVMDARGLVIFPGLIEIHAHLREPGQTHKEDFQSGSRAALAGGYTLVYDMPNNSPVPTITAAAYEEKKERAKKALCELRFHFGATKTNIGEVKKAAPESLKIYMGRTTGTLLLDDEKNIAAHMASFPASRQVFVHAQDQETLDALGDSDGAQAAAGEIGAQKAVSLARALGRKVHITHAAGARELAIARSWELGTVDCAPHYLFLSREDAEKGGREAKMLGVTPALCSREEVAGLWKNLDLIDAIATDHAPHLAHEKEGGAAGFPGLETALALFLDAYSKRRIRLEWIARRFCENPAGIMGLRGYGKIEAGAPANLAFLDLKKEWSVRGSEMHSKALWTPFEGRKLKGRVVRTMWKGTVAYDLQ